MMIKAFYDGSIATFSSRLGGIWCRGHRSNTIALQRKQQWFPPVPRAAGQFCFPLSQEATSSSASSSRASFSYLYPIISLCTWKNLQWLFYSATTWQFRDVREKVTSLIQVILLDHDIGKNRTSLENIKDHLWRTGVDGKEKTAIVLLTAF